MSQAGSRIIKKRLIRLNLVLITVLVATAFFRFSGIFNNKVSRIRVESDFDISGFDIYSLAGFDSPNILGKVPDEAELKRNLEAVPQVRKAYVEKQFPETLRLVLYQREPVGICLLEVDGVSVPCLFDKTGYIYKEADSGDEWDFPLISGLSKEKASPGNRLDDVFLPLVYDLEKLKEGSPALYALISEIHIVEGDNYGFKSEVSFIPYRIKAILGERLTTKKIKQTLIVLDEMTINGMDLKLDEVDFRSGEAVFSDSEGDI